MISDFSYYSDDWASGKDREHQYVRIDLTELFKYRNSHLKRKRIFQSFIKNDFLLLNKENCIQLNKISFYSRVYLTIEYNDD
jgi:hypothetical protein